MAHERKFSFGEDPTPEEAAATIAAIERFMADTASAAPAESSEIVSGWLRAALAEGVGGRDDQAIW